MSAQPIDSDSSRRFAGCIPALAFALAAALPGFAALLLASCAPSPLEQARQNLSIQAESYIERFRGDPRLLESLAAAKSLCADVRPLDRELRSLGPGETLPLLSRAAANEALAAAPLARLRDELRRYLEDRLPLSADANDRAYSQDVVQLLQPAPEAGPGRFSLLGDAALARDATQSTPPEHLCALLEPASNEAEVLESALARDEVRASELFEDRLGVYLIIAAPFELSKDGANPPGDLNKGEGARLLLLRKHDASALAEP